MSLKILRDDEDIYIERNDAAKGRYSLIDTMRVERGTIEDWYQLHEFHYKAETIPPGPHFWRCVTQEGDLAGLVVFGTVGLLLAPRHEIFPKLKPGNDTKISNTQRGRWLNTNFKRAARIVTDTLYRGVGISYRMVNLAMRLEGFRFIEIQSSMSKFNPFDVKAGFVHANLKHARAYEKGIAFMRGVFEAHPADHEAVMQEFKAMPPAVQRIVESTVKEFYYKNSAKEKTGSNLGVGMDVVNQMPFARVLKELQQLIFASPVYGIWENPDLGRELPESLPLRAFDLQPPNAPLRLDLL